MTSLEQLNTIFKECGVSLEEAVTNLSECIDAVNRLIVSFADITTENPNENSDLEIFEQKRIQPLELENFIKF